MDQIKTTQVKVEHQGNGWLSFTCPTKENSKDSTAQSTIELKLYNQKGKNKTTNYQGYSLYNQMKLKLAKVFAWNDNEKTIIDILIQSIKADGTISLNASLPNLNKHTKSELAFWSTIQLDGDITFGVNQKVLYLDDFDQYAEGFFQVQNQFLNTIQSALRAVGIKFKIIIGLAITTIMASSAYPLIQQHLGG